MRGTTVPSGSSGLGIEQLGVSNSDPGSTVAEGHQSASGLTMIFRYLTTLFGSCA